MYLFHVDAKNEKKNQEIFKYIIVPVFLYFIEK